MDTIQKSIKKWIKKLWCIHALEYFEAIERDKVLVQAMTEMHLKKYHM